MASERKQRKKKRQRIPVDDDADHEVEMTIFNRDRFTVKCWDKENIILLNVDNKDVRVPIKNFTRTFAWHIAQQSIVHNV